MLWPGFAESAVAVATFESNRIETMLIAARFLKRIRLSLNSLGKSKALRKESLAENP
jgi:hypothetical protein